MISPARWAKHIRSRVWDYFLYTIIAFAFLGAVFAVENKWGHEVFIRWGGLAGFTLCLFGYFIADSRELSRVWHFWVLTALLLSMHLAGFAILLSHVDEWKLMWFTVMVIEYPILLLLREKFLS